VPARFKWSFISDERLLDTRICDLPIRIKGSFIEPHIKRLYSELNDRGIRFKPHVWLSAEWFTPDGVPGFAIPFYLAHPRLMKLERKFMREIEGGTDVECMRILRHEAGHALDNAFRLHFKRQWIRTFGSFAQKYPPSYKPKPNSRRYVLNLDAWYAQAHPAEDFAETFAVWLKPKSDWRRSYADWPAYNKLALVDELMTSVRDRRPAVRDRTRIEPIHTNTRTLAQHYRRKLAHRRYYRRGVADDLLQKVFSTQRLRKNAARASTMLRAARPALVAAVSRELGMERYTVQQILRILIERSDHLKLYVRGGRRDALRPARWMLARITSMYGQGETPHLPL